MTDRGTSLKSVTLLSGCSLLHLAVQFLLQMVLAALFGTGSERDAYAGAIAFPLVVGTILVGSLNYVFVPVFVERRERLGAEAAWRTASVVGLQLLFILAGLTVISFLAAKPIVALLCHRFDAAQLAVTVRLFRILIWLTLSNGVVIFLQSLHHAEGRFAVPAVAQPIASALTVVITLLLHDRLGITAVAYAVVAAGGVSIVLQLLPLVRHFRFSGLADEGAGRIVRLLIPLVLGAAYYKLDPLVNWYLASEETGAISKLDIAWQIIAGLLTLSTSGIGIVIFPVIAKYSAAGDFGRLKGEVAYAMRFLVFVLTPAVVGLLLFGRPVIRDLYERGEFSASDTTAVATLVALYAGVLVGASVGEVGAKVFYALKDMRTPVIVGACGFTLGVGAKFWFFPLRGVNAIAAATSAYYLLNAAVMIALIGRRLNGMPAEGVLRAGGRALLGTAGAAGAAFLVMQIALPFMVVPAALLAVLAYGVVMFLLKDEFALKLVAYANRKRRPVVGEVEEHSE